MRSGGIPPISPPVPETVEGECEKCPPETCIPVQRELDYVVVLIRSGAGRFV